jgi:tetratricopeptide (TPR) repeat protein
MKKIIVGIIVLWLAIWGMQTLQRKSAEKSRTPPLPKEYRLLNEIAELNAKGNEGWLATLSNTGKLMKITGRQRAALQKELVRAVQEYPEEPLVISTVALTAESDIMQVDSYEDLMALIRERPGREGESPKDRKALESHRKHQEEILRQMRSYLVPIARNAREECEAMTCEGPYIKLMLLAQMAYYLERTGDPEEAEEYLRLAIDNLDRLEALEREQVKQDLHTQLGMLYLKQKRYDEAIEELEASRPERITFDILLNGWSDELASGLYEAGYTEAALAYWKDAVAFWEKKLREAKKEKEAALIRKRFKGAKELLREIQKEVERGENPQRDTSI